MPVCRVFFDTGVGFGVGVVVSGSPLDPKVRVTSQYSSGVRGCSHHSLPVYPFSPEVRVTYFFRGGGPHSHLWDTLGRESGRGPSLFHGEWEGRSFLSPAGCDGSVVLRWGWGVTVVPCVLLVTTRTHEGRPTTDVHDFPFGWVRAPTAR